MIKGNEIVFSLDLYIKNKKIWETFSIYNALNKITLLFSKSDQQLMNHDLCHNRMTLQDLITMD